MSAGVPAIPAAGPFLGSHAPPIGQLRVARHPNRPHSGPLRAFQPQGHTSGYPPETSETPVNAVSKRRWLARSTAPPRTSIQGGRSVDDMADGFVAQRVIDEWIEFYNEIRPHSALDGRMPAAAYCGVAAPGQQGGVADMGSRWQLRVPRAEDEREHNPVRGVIHNIHRIKPPLPRTPSPCYRHLFLRGRGGATITEVHLNLPPGLTPQLGSPLPALLVSPTLTVDTIPRFRPNQSSSKGGPNLPLLTSIEMTPDASAVVTFHRIHWKGSPESTPRVPIRPRYRKTAR